MQLIQADVSWGTRSSPSSKKNFPAQNLLKHLARKGDNFILECTKFFKRRRESNLRLWHPVLPKIMTSCDGEPVMFVCVITRDTYALNQSLEFIRSSLSNLDVASQFECEKGEADD